MGVSLGETLLGYGLGGLGAGITYGLLKPLARTRLGSFFVGILIAAAAFAPFGFVANDPLAWQVVAGMTVIFGTIGGLSMPRFFAIGRDFDDAEERYHRLMAGELSDEEIAALEREYQADLERRKASRRSRPTS
jgi:hypothetical protein